MDRLKLFGSLALLLIYLLWFLNEPGYEPFVGTLPLLGGIILILVKSKPTQHFIWAAIGLGIVLGSFSTLLAPRVKAIWTTTIPHEAGDAHPGGADTAIFREDLAKCRTHTSSLTREMSEARRRVASLETELEDCKEQKGNFPSPPLPPVTQQGFRFDLGGCQRSGEDVVCNLTVTSLTEDRLLLVAVDQVGGLRVVGVGYTTMVDDTAGTHVAKSVTVGNQINETNGQIELELVGDLPTPMMLTFSGLSQRAKSAAKLAIACSTRAEEGGRRRMFQPVFRNVRIAPS